MTTGNTSLLGLALPVEGELDGTWGDVVNDSITSLVDSAVAGTTTLSADSDVTLTDTALAANQARQAIILWTASNGATTRNITAPARSKAYAVINAGTGSIVLRGAGPTTGVTIVSGERCVAAWNGSDFVKIATSTADGVTTFSGGTTGLTPSTATSGAVTLAGTLVTANGGTGLASFTANGVVYASSTSALTTGGVLTFDGSNFGVLAGSVTTPAAKIHAVGSVRASNGAGTIYSSLSSDGLYSFNTDLYLFAPTGFANIFYANNAEQMRLTATGLGIGTASPAAKFDLVGDYKEGVVTANTGTAYTISTATGTLQILTLTGNCTFTFPTATTGESFTLFLRQDGTGGRTVTWPANVRWPGGTAPTITSTASRQDKYIFTADGTNFYGSNAGQNYTV
jgi:hypothetical protein